MATTPDVSFTSREIAVMAEVLARIAVPSFTASDWKDIAAKAGITDGDVARNAKYSFAQAKKKFGVKEGQNGKKSKDSSEEEDVSTSKKKRGRAAEGEGEPTPKKKRGRPAKKAVVKEDDEEEEKIKDDDDQEE
ncbi:hypothetical protein ANO11243_066350 [Dothideomycetidae sp. 11243]|nr:hypothetical protein ANO11243_066350 [fungal sp. No.11243]